MDTELERLLGRLVSAFERMRVNCRVIRLRTRHSAAN